MRIFPAKACRIVEHRSVQALIAEMDRQGEVTIKPKSTAGHDIPTRVGTVVNFAHRAGESAAAVRYKPVIFILSRNAGAPIPKASAITQIRFMRLSFSYQTPPPNKAARQTERGCTPGFSVLKNVG